MRQCTLTLSVPQRKHAVGVSNCHNYIHTKFYSKRVTSSMQNNMPAYELSNLLMALTQWFSHVCAPHLLFHVWSLSK